MKLESKNYKKQVLGGGVIIHTYTCNDKEFHIRIERSGVKYIYQGNDFPDDMNKVKATNDNVEAFTLFEEMVAECNKREDDDPANNFKNNPRETPGIIPLLAVKKQGATVKFSLFGYEESSGQQVSAMDFELPESSFSLPKNYKTSFFEKDFSNENVPDFFKCEIIFMFYDKVLFEADPDAEVFAFIPKAMTTQGGNPGKGGGEIPMPPDEEDGTPGDKPDDDGGTPGGKSKKGGKGKPEDEPNDDEPQDEDQPDDDDTDGGTPGDEPQDEDQPKDEDEPENEDEPQGEKPKGEPKSSAKKAESTGASGEFKPSEVSDLINKIAEIGNINPDIAKRFFISDTTAKTLIGRVGLQKIKKELNLSPSTTADDIIKAAKNP